MFPNKDTPCSWENEVIQERSRDMPDVVDKTRLLSRLFCISCRDIICYNNIKRSGKYSWLHAKLHWKKNEHCCVVQMHGLEHTRCFQRFRTMLPFFGCPKFSVWVYNTSDVPTGQTFAINWSKIQLSWVLMLYYPYETVFSVYKSVIATPCACNLFVSKVTKITRFMDLHFWW